MSKKKTPEKNVVHDFHVKTRARVYDRFLKYNLVPRVSQIYGKTPNLHVQITPFCTFLCHHCNYMTTTWSCLIILCFMEDVNKRPRNFLSLSELGYMWLFIGILLQESSPTFEKVSEVVTKLASCYMTLFHNFRPRVLRQEPWSSRSHLAALWKLQILEFDFFIARKISSRVSAKVIKFCYWPLQKIP